jgi:hypothetical protein
VTPPSIAICDSCGSVAWWAVDGSGDIWTLCKDESCETRVQVAMFEEEPIWKDRGTRPVRGDDANENTPF